MRVFPETFVNKYVFAYVLSLLESWDNSVLQGDCSRGLSQVPSQRGKISRKKSAPPFLKMITVRMVTMNVTAADT